MPDQDVEPDRINEQRFDDLELFLARATCKNVAACDYESTLFDLFDFSIDSTSSLPFAPVSYLGDTGNVANGWMMRSDPVHLTPGRDDLILTGPDSLSITLHEAEYLAAELNDFFKEDGWHIEVVTPGRWYLHLTTEPGIQSQPLSKVMNRAIANSMPDGEKGKYWRRVMNEIQMVLHRSEVNLHRQAENRLPINSMWFWGEGVLPETRQSRWTQLWSMEPMSLGLAHLTFTPHGHLPDDGHVWLEKYYTSGQHLLVYDRIHSDIHLDNTIGNRSVMQFQENWITPLLQALRDGSLDQLELVPCNGKQYQLTPGGLKRWWRRKKPFYFYCK